MKQGKKYTNHGKTSKNNKRRLTKFKGGRKGFTPVAPTITLPNPEKSELKYQTMSYQMNQYMERADENDPTCIRVEMDNGKRLDLDAPTEQVIFTYGLCGCIATALCIEMTNGEKMVILTHNSPLTIITASLNLHRLTTEVTPEAVKNAKFFILAPGEYEQNTEGTWELKVKQKNEMDLTLLEITTKAIGGENTEVERIAYSESQVTGAKNQGTFALFTGKDGKIMLTVENNPSRAVFP